MELLLTSTGLANEIIRDQFLKLIRKAVSTIKVIFIPTASRTKEKLNYVQEAKQELLDLGVLRKNIKTVNLDTKVNYAEVKNYDVIYVCGGNTFFLLKKVRETGFDKIIAKFVHENKLYFGVSAGSIIVCPNIEIASLGDENDVGLKDLTGLGLVDVVVSPQYNIKEKSYLFSIVRSKSHPYQLREPQGDLPHPGMRLQRYL
ncbi:Type 1 glutamine amidotransferase-like domain-containing protein [Candidatus Woesearchaeota archaeon]|nr:Type 1 glutamine amidotransferase-like domain-containing protein [Candidatus Woesearchaeota archaeon]